MEFDLWRLKVEMKTEINEGFSGCSSLTTLRVTARKAPWIITP